MAAMSPAPCMAATATTPFKGGAGADKLYGEQGDDNLDGGNGGDTYSVSGNKEGGWSSFNGYDNYADVRARAANDRIVAQGDNVDIGLRSSSAQRHGIEVIDAQRCHRHGAADR
jgi:Ca2+-binding RTX toxin-like protein